MDDSLIITLPNGFSIWGSGLTGRYVIEGPNGHRCVAFDTYAEAMAWIENL